MKNSYIKRVMVMLAWVGVVPAQAADKWQKNEPDYTQGEVLLGFRGDKDGTRYWLLGPIGAVGNIWATRDGTVRTRMIQIREVLQGTPADGVLKQQDVLLGVASPRVLPAKDVLSEMDVPVDEQCGRPGCKGVRGSCGHFAWDVRKALAAAIAEAERKEHGGKLVLNIWRPATERVEVPLDKVLRGKALHEAKKRGEKRYQFAPKHPVMGETMQVALTLPVLDTYGATSPWDCGKTKAMIARAAQSILKKGLGDGGIATKLDVLGLLATGEEQIPARGAGVCPAHREGL